MIIDLSLLLMLQALEESPFMELVLRMKTLILLMGVQVSDIGLTNIQDVSLLEYLMDRLLCV
jgi:hypothetical protein